MKSAYELAMERLEKEKPSGPPLSEEQKKAIAEINEKCESQMAQARIMAEKELQSAYGDYQAEQQIKAKLAQEIQRLEEDREFKKQKIRERNG